MWLLPILYEKYNITFTLFLLLVFYFDYFFILLFVFFFFLLFVSLMDSISFFLFYFGTTLKYIDDEGIGT